jgi:hypothetical protein
MKTLKPSREWRAAFIAAAKAFDESKYVRNEGGEFAPKGTGAATKKAGASKKPAKTPTVNYDGRDVAELRKEYAAAIKKGDYATAETIDRAIDKAAKSAPKDTPTAAPAAPRGTLEPLPAAERKAAAQKIVDAIGNETPIADVFRKSGLSVGKFHDIVNSLRESGAITAQPVAELARYKWNDDHTFLSAPSGDGPQIFDRLSRASGNIPDFADESPSAAEVAKKLDDKISSTKGYIDLGDLFNEIAKPAGISVGQFQDSLRELSKSTRGRIRLIPFTRPPMYTPPEMQKAGFVQGQEFKGYVVNDPMNVEEVTAAWRQRYQAAKLHI